MTMDIAHLVEIVRKALVRVDSETAETPDYDVLAQVAVRVVLEQIAKDAVAEAVQG